MVDLLQSRQPIEGSTILTMLGKFGSRPSNPITLEVHINEY